MTIFSDFSSCPSMVDYYFSWWCVWGGEILNGMFYPLVICPPVTVVPFLSISLRTD